MSEFLTITAVVLTLIAPLVYVRSILRGESSPHRMTRFVLVFIMIVTTASLFSSGDYAAAWYAAANLLLCVVIFAVSIKHGMGGWSKGDILCLVVAFIGVVLWQTTDNPTWSLAFAVLADGVGSMPAVIKTWRRPDTEGPAFHAIGTVAGLLVVFAAPEPTFQALAFPVYTTVVDSTMTVLSLRRPKTLVTN